MKAAGSELKKREKKPLPKAVKAACKYAAITILTLALIFFTVDYLYVNRYKQPPIFCVPLIKYDNGSVDYYGLFYKIWADYDPFEGETEYYTTLWLLPKFWNI